MSVLHGRISGSQTLNLLYTWALSLLCPVLSLNRITCSGPFSLWGGCLTGYSLGITASINFFILEEGFDGGLFIGVGGRTHNSKGKFPLSEAQRRIESATLRHAGQRVQHTTD